MEGVSEDTDTEDLQVALLLCVMGEEALDIFNSFTFANEKKKTIILLLKNSVFSISYHNNML